MTVREELEILRGEPIEVFARDATDIPCIETSDSDKLCKHPVVSVSMITYNHEPYIRQAIEGVMMQETDFEFELIIGEDCSQDKTREICFEYQKQYPDKIRVLWWHENLYRNPQLGGGNGRRNLAHCRGEYIALCEGDDCWTDPHKLQAQVDLMRRHQSVGLCFADAVIHHENSGHDVRWHGEYPEGVCAGKDFMQVLIFGVGPLCQYPVGVHVNTATCLMRKSLMDRAVSRFDIFKWRLCLGDTTLWLGIASFADVYYFPKCVSLYRKHSGGATSSNLSNVLRDGWIIRKYFADELKLKQANPKGYQCLLKSIIVTLVGILRSKSLGVRIKTGVTLLKEGVLGESALFSRYVVVALLFLFGICNRVTLNLINRYLNLLAIVSNDGFRAYIRRKG